MRRILPLILGVVALAAIASQITVAMKPGIYAAIISAASVAIVIPCLKRELWQPMLPRLLACAVGMPLIAWSLSSAPLLLAIMAVWVPLVAARMSYVVPVYLYSLMLLPGLDETVALGSVKLFDFGVHDALALGAAAIIFASPGKARMRSAIDLPAVLILLVLSAALSRNTTATHLVRMTINVVLDLGLPYYILSRGIRTMDELRNAMLWLGLSGVTLAALLTYEAWKAWPLYNTLYPIYDVPTLLLVKMRGGVLRAGGPFVEPTSAAMVLATCALAIWQSRSMFRSGVLHGLICAVVLGGLIAPQSRGAWIGLILAIIVALLFCGRIGRLLQMLGAGGAIGALLFVMAAASPQLSESLGMSGGSSETSDYRRQLFDRGMEEFWHSPIVGYSMPEITVRLSDLRQGEGIVDFVNAYVWIVLISGAVGLTIFLGAFAFFGMRVLSQRRRLLQTPEGAAVGAFALAALVMPAEMLFFTSFGGRPAFMVFAIFGFAAALLRIQARADQPTVPEPQIGQIARTT